MKSFVASMLVFGMLLCAILLNYNYVLRVCVELEQKIDTLPACSEAAEAVDDLMKRWETESRKLKLSISLHQIDKMEECLSDLYYAAHYGDANIFEQSRCRAKTIIRDIRDGEMPLAENFM